jgi:hypothetical protein
MRRFARVSAWMAATSAAMTAESNDSSTRVRRPAISPARVEETAAVA